MLRDDWVVMHSHTYCGGKQCAGERCNLQRGCNWGLGPKKTNARNACRVRVILMLRLTHIDHPQRPWTGRDKRTGYGIPPRRTLTVATFQECSAQKSDTSISRRFMIRDRDCETRPLNGHVECVGTPRRRSRLDADSAFSHRGFISHSRGIT